MSRTLPVRHGDQRDRQRARQYHRRQQQRQHPVRTRRQRHPVRVWRQRHPEWRHRQRYHGGGTGNDTYVVDSAGDVVVEAAGEGTDRVYAYVNYTLGANVENLTLSSARRPAGPATTSTMSSTATATPTPCPDSPATTPCTGMTATIPLDGGAGNDTMAGGTGDDTYVVDSAGDVVSEAAGAGTDTVNAYDSTIPWAPTSRTLTCSARRPDGNGNDLDNVINGNSNANTLYGGRRQRHPVRRDRQRPSSSIPGAT